MEILEYTPDFQASLTQFYNRLISDVPHCYPVKEQEFAQAIQNVVPDKYDKSQGDLYGETAFVATTGGTVKAFVHLGISLKAENEEEDVGFIKFLGYARGDRQTGQNLLEKAEEYLKTYNVSRIFACSANDRYRFYHLEYANLSNTLDHVHALLGFNGYHPEQHWIVLNWENYDVTPISAPIPITISVDWKEGRGKLPNCDVTAHRDNEKREEIGKCESVSGGEFSSHPDAQDWVYTEWLGVEEEYQGQGVGKYLLQYSLQEMHKVGYRHAAISTSWDNKRALLFYTNCGYKVVDWTYEYQKVLSEVTV